MDASPRSSCLLVLLGVLALALGCSGADASSTSATRAAPRREASADPLAHFGPVPRLFSESDGAARALRLYLPQPDGSARLVKAACTSPTEVQRIFGIGTLDLVELLSDDDYDALFDLEWDGYTFSCPEAKPEKVEFVRTGAAETFLLEVTRGVAARAGDAGTTGPGSLVLSIPKSCERLLEHYQVSARVQELRDKPPTSGLIADLTLRCGPPRSDDRSSAWRADIVLAGRDLRPLVALSNGTRSVYLHRVDGLTPGAAQRERVLARVESLFVLPARGAPPSLKAIAAPEIAFDVCVEQCEGFRPRHLVADAQRTRLGCPDAAPDAPLEACAAAPWLLHERRAASGERIHVLTRRDAPDVSLETFAVCDPPTDVTDVRANDWPRILGLAVQRTPQDLLAIARDRYGKADDDAVPCVRDTSCTVALEPNADLGDPRLLAKVDQKCWQGERTVTFQLASTAVSTRPLVLSSPGRCTGSAPQGSGGLHCNIEAVRFTAASDAGAVIHAASGQCGSSCSTLVPVISASGPLTVELENVRILVQAAAPTSATSAAPAPERPSHRVAVDLQRGATLFLRRSEIGAPELDTPVRAQFFVGIKAVGATLHAWQSSVRAFSTAIAAQSTQVTMLTRPTDTRVELRALVGERGYGDLFHFTGSPLVDVRNFVGLLLSSGSRAFLGRVQVAAPVGVSYQSAGAERDALTAVDTLIGWKTDCASKLFREQSVALELRGNGELKFVNVDVSGVGGLLACRGPERATAVFERSTFDNVRSRLDVGVCKVTTELPVSARACPP